MAWTRTRVVVDRWATGLMCVGSALVLVALLWIKPLNYWTNLQRQRLLGQLAMIRYLSPDEAVRREKAFEPTGLVFDEARTEWSRLWAGLAAGVLIGLAGATLGWWVKTRWASYFGPFTAVYVPALEWLLREAETRKGSPLSEEEVRRIRRGAVFYTVSVEEAKRLYPSRLLSADLSPDDCWDAWQRVRNYLFATTAAHAAGLEGQTPNHLLHLTGGRDGTTMPTAHPPAGK